jgi:hypothetical protein
MHRKQEAKLAIGFPTYTVILFIVASIGTGVGSWLILSEGLATVPIAPHIKRIWRWGAAIVLIAWLLVLLAWPVNPAGGVVLGRAVGITSLVLGLLAGILPLLISPIFRQIVRAVPQTWLVGIHALRVLGFVWLALADMKLLPTEFALPAGFGDVTVGLLALVMAYLLAKRNPYARALVIGWNVLGLLDFVVALTTGLIYIRPFAAQVAASGVSTLYLNYVFLVPTFAIPLLAVLHLYSLFQMRSARVDKTTPDHEGPLHTPVFPAEQRSVHP